MKRIVVLCILGLCLFSKNSNADDLSIYNPNFYCSILGMGGRHDVHFKNFAHSPGLSFGIKVNLGFHVVRKRQYLGGLYFSLMDAASNNPNRRQLSEDFVLPNNNFDKHLVYNFAMFRSSTIGWQSEIQGPGFNVYHQIGLGIFGLTENNPLFNLGLQNVLGILIGHSWRNKLDLAICHDTMIGSGNPNYGVNNIGVTFGLRRLF